MNDVHESAESCRKLNCLFTSRLPTTNCFDCFRHHTDCKASHGTQHGQQKTKEVWSFETLSDETAKTWSLYSFCQSLTRKVLYGEKLKAGTSIHLTFDFSLTSSYLIIFLFLVIVSLYKSSLLKLKKSKKM